MLRKLCNQYIVDYELWINDSFQSELVLWNANYLINVVMNNKSES